MGSAESERLDLYNRLQEVLGVDPATTLMTDLRRTSKDLVTSEQFGLFETDMRDFKTEMRDFKTEMRDFETEMRDFKTEMREFKTEMRDFKTEMRDFRTETLLRFGDVDRRIDRVLLAVVGGQFVMLAAIIGTAAFL